MGSALRELVIPQLRQAGFRGSLPHLRRPQDEWIDLITFQFDKWGGGLVIELARCSLIGVTMPWGKSIGPKNVRAWDVSHRKRIQARPGSSVDDWFRFDTQSPTETAKQIMAALNAPDLWTDVTMPDT